MPEVVQWIAGGALGATLAVLATPLLSWLFRRSRDGERWNRPDDPLPEVARDLAGAYGGYAMILTPRHRVLYSSALADTLPVFQGAKLIHPGLQELAENAWRAGEIQSRRLSFTDLGPVAQADVRATRLAGRYVLLTVTDLTATMRSRQIRHDFIANIGHELRTPVTAVDLIASALAAGAEDAKTVRHFSARLTQESHRLARLTQDMMALAKAQDQDSSRFTLTPLRDLLDQAVGRNRTTAEEAAIDVRVIAPDQVDVFGDRDALVTAVDNLIANAVAYSPPGSQVDVTARADSSEVVIAVSDQGIGIEPEDQERVFERFYRTDRARSRRTGGTGLGLAIVRNTVSGHGGRVTVKSEVGAGSTFTIRLPRPRSLPVAKRAATAPTSGRRVPVGSKGAT
ncbi:MAG: HAMP domain-containing histidine kinase [Bifidobacteriaceae bacterium]|nr:HAMP domain-containing histidine kinase [Bifidobacteriaceae bacterium]